MKSNKLSEALHVVAAVLLVSMPLWAIPFYALVKPALAWIADLLLFWMPQGI